MPRAAKRGPAGGLDAKSYRALKLKPAHALSTAEMRVLKLQEEYERANYGFFLAYLTERQCEMAEAFKEKTEIIIRGGVRSGKTAGDIFCVCCRVGNVYPVGYIPMKTKYGDIIYKPVLERFMLPDTQKVAKVWISVLTRLLGAAPGGMQQTLVQMLPKPWIKCIHTVGGKYITDIELANGGEIGIKSADAGREAYQSAALDLLIMDEGHRKEIVEEATSRSGSYPLKFIYSYFPIPDEGTSWAHESYILPELEGRTPDYRKVMAVNYTENTMIPKPAREKQIKIWMDAGVFKERVLGEFGEIKGRVYKDFSRTVHVMNAMDVPGLKDNAGEPPDHWFRFMGIDCHNSRKGCTAVMCAIDPSNGRSVYYNEYQSAGDPSTWFEYFNRINSEHPFELVWIDPSCYSTDAAGYCIGEKFEELTSLPIEKANRDRVNGIRAVQQRLQVLKDEHGNVVDGLPGLVVCEHCYNTIRQMETYSRKSDNFADVLKVNDEYCDDIRYIEINEPHKFFGSTLYSRSSYDPTFDEDRGNPNIVSI